jgi:hypothetical protein
LMRRLGLLLLRSSAILAFQLSFKIYAKWTVAVILISYTHRERAVRRVCFKTYQKSPVPDIFCLAEMLKTRFSALEVLRTVHPCKNIIDILCEFVFHLFFQMPMGVIRTVPSAGSYNISRECSVVYPKSSVCLLLRSGPLKFGSSNSPRSSPDL